MRGCLRRCRDGFRTNDQRLARRHRSRGAHRYPLDHRPTGMPARIVRVGKAGAGRVFHAGGREAALRHVRARITRHRCGVRGVPCDCACRGGPGVADGARRRPGVLRTRRHAGDHPQHQADQEEHRGPGQQPDDPRPPVQRDLDAIAATIGFFRHRCLSPSQTFEMAARSLATGRSLFRDRFERSHEADIAGHAVMGRGRVVRTAPARTRRHPARHDHHRRNPGYAEQAEQARVDGDPGLRAAEAHADFFRGLAQAARADAAQHQRRTGVFRRAEPRGVARPLTPARRRHRQAGEDQDFGRIRPPRRERRRMAFGRERDGRPAGRPRSCPPGSEAGAGSPRSWDGLPSGFPGAVQRAFDYAARPFAERVRAVAAGPLQHPVHHLRRIDAGHPERRTFVRTGQSDTGRHGQGGAERDEVPG